MAISKTEASLASSLTSMDTETVLSTVRSPMAVLARSRKTLRQSKITVRKNNTDERDKRVKAGTTSVQFDELEK